MKKDISRLILEGVEIDKAEVILASKGISDDIQDMIEKLSKIQIEDLEVMREGITRAFGLLDSEHYIKNIDGVLEETIENLKSSKEHVEKETYILTGEEIIDMDDEEEDTLSDEPDIDGHAVAASRQGPPEEPLGRRKIESKEHNKTSLKLQEMSKKKLLFMKKKLEKISESGEKITTRKAKFKNRVIKEIARRIFLEADNAIATMSDEKLASLLRQIVHLSDQIEKKGGKMARDDARLVKRTQDEMRKRGLKLEEDRPIKIRKKIRSLSLRKKLKHRRR